MSGIASFDDTAALSERRLQDPNGPPAERKKRVVVTGGSGKLGRWVVREMVEHGWEVYNGESRGCYPALYVSMRPAATAPRETGNRAETRLTPVDAVPPAPSEAAVKAKFLQGDLKDYGQVIGLLGEVDSGYRGIDAVIHLAAIAAPARTVRRARCNLPVTSGRDTRPLPTLITSTSMECGARSR